VAVAIRPSRVWANLTVTKGMPVRMYLKKTSFNCRQASAKTRPLFRSRAVRGLEYLSGYLWIGIGRADDDAAGATGDHGVDTGGVLP